jgi:hypothetical protein
VVDIGGVDTEVVVVTRGMYWILDTGAPPLLLAGVFTTTGVDGAPPPPPPAGGGVTGDVTGVGVRVIET